MSQESSMNEMSDAQRTPKRTRPSSQPSGTEDTPQRWLSRELDAPDDPIVSESPGSSMRSPFYRNFSTFYQTQILCTFVQFVCR